MPAAGGAEGGLSRRALFGAGLPKRLSARLEGMPGAAVGAPPRPARREPAVDPAAVARAAHEALWLCGAPRTVFAAGADDALRAAAGPLGWQVVAEAPAGAAIGWFGASGDPDCRALAQQLTRAAGPASPVVVAAAAGGRWSRYETAYRHLCGLDQFDVFERDGYSLAFAITPA